MRLLPLSLPQPPTHTRPHTTPHSNTARRFRTWLGGWVLVLGSLAFMLFSLYAIVVAKLLPPTGWAWLDAVRADQYFCFLVPLTLAPTTVLGYLNWVAMEFYQAN